MVVPKVQVPALLNTEEQQMWARLTDVVVQSDQQHWQACLPYTEAIKKVMLASPWCLQNWFAWSRRFYDTSIGLRHDLWNRTCNGLLFHPKSTRRTHR